MTLTTGGYYFYPDRSLGGDPLTWLAQRLTCWQKANPSAVVYTVSDTQLAYVVPNPMPPGLILIPGGPDYAASANAGWQIVNASASMVKTIDPNTCAESGAGTPVLQPWQFSPEAFGAKGDNVADDSAAINAAFAAGHGYAMNTTAGLYEIVFGADTYYVGKTPITGGATMGSAMLPVPMALTDSSTSTKKITPVLTGAGTAASGLYHWQQQQPNTQRAGTVLRTDYDGGDSIPATGEVSVLGGPTPHFIGSTPSVWNNVRVVINGISVEVPANPNVCGVDLRGCAEASVRDLTCLAEQTATGAPPIPNPRWAFGLAMPLASNNDLCDIDAFQAEGFTYGGIWYEHVKANAVRFVNNYLGMIVWSSLSTPHENIVTYASIENCTKPIEMAGSTGKLDVLECDIEWIPSGGQAGPIFTDACTTPATGTINLGSNGVNGDTLNAALNAGPAAPVGTTNMRLVNRDQKTGAVTAPTVPASGTPLQNPFWRPASIALSGGTVTSVSIDGQVTGLTSGLLPTLDTGKSVTLVYTGTPTWTWTIGG